MAKLNPNKVALAFASFLAALTLLLSVVLAIGGQAFFTLWMRLHYVSGISLQPVTISTAIATIAYHFVAGAVIGWLFAVIWNRVHL